MRTLRGFGYMLEGEWRRMRKISLRDGLLFRLLVPMCTVLLVSGVLSYALAVNFRSCQLRPCAA